MRTRERLCEVLLSVNRDALRVGSALSEAMAGMVIGAVKRAALAVKMETGDRKVADEISYVLKCEPAVSPHVRELLGEAARYLEEDWNA